MSIFKINNHFRLHREVAVLFTVLFCVLLFFPICSYAEEATTAELVFSKKLYHKHVGTEGVYGGCYTKAETIEKTVEKECGGSMAYWPELGTSSCSRCGAGYTGDQSGRKCFKTTYETVKETTYVLGCDMSEGTPMGTLTVTKNTGEWTKSVILQASYKVNSKVSVKSKPFIWNGTAATDNPELVVTENGTYTLKLNAGSNVNAQKGTISVEVKNIDVTGPAFSFYEKDPKTDWTTEGVCVYNITAQDQQPDGTAGCGLHEKPFSFDAGTTWIADNTCFYQDNGSYEVLVRDRLDNITKQSIIISNIDKTPPTARAEYVREANQPSVRIAITASDLQLDGTAGCGLHDQPYSYDGGKNWREEAVYTVSKNRVVEIAVRDKLGNTVYLNEKIDNIDSWGPKLEYTVEPEEWTHEKVILRLAATDINEDGTEGSGLPEEWYSLDDGNSWKSETELEFVENQTLQVILRDLHNNQTREEITIDNIDTQAPKVSLRSREVTIGDSKRVEIIIKAKDEQSGLEKKAYSWNGGAYTDKRSMVVSENGSYAVKVRDRAGNVGKAVIQVNSFPEKEEESEESEEEPPVSTEESTSTEEEESTEQIVSTEETSSTEEVDTTDEVTEQESWDEMESETVVVTLEELGEELEGIVPQEVKKDKGMSIGKWITILLLALAALLLAILLLLAWLRSMAVYGKNVKGEWKYLGRVWILRREERYSVRVEEELFEKCETAQFRFHPAWGFAQMHEEEEMYFYFPEGICMMGKICEKIEIALYK